MTEPKAIYAPTSIRARLSALFEALLQDSRIGKAFQPVILNLGRSFISSATDQELREGIVKVRDEIIPFLLEEPHEDKDPQ